MSEVAANDTHYMTFPHSVTGVIRGGFTIKLFKNGALLQDQPVEIKEVSTKIYTASFSNDGTDFSLWTLVISDPNVANIYYVETWSVRRKTVDLNVKQIRSRQDSDGGFFKKS